VRDPDALGSTHLNRARASSFGANAELYDRTRPSYPDALVDDLVGPSARTVLDVGCGTGLLGRSFLARGLAVTGVEPDASMADVARRHGLAVEESTFESWAPAGRTFDLLISGQAWHWVDPVAGTDRAAEALVAGGRLALVWNEAVFPDALRAQLDEAYTPFAAAGGPAPTICHRPQDWLGSGGSEEVLRAHDAFSDVELRTYPWDHVYTTQAWLAQLETHSDHALMAPDARASLLAAVAETLDANGGAFTMHYDCKLTTAVRR
jgi:SAM-dependent methyltransferase